MASKLLTDEFQKNIQLNVTCHSMEEAIRHAGQLLVDQQYVKDGYIDSMLEREKKYPTYIGFGVMIPHCIEEGIPLVLKPGISIIQIPKGFSYLGHTVTLVIGIASREEDSLQVLMQIADILADEEKREYLLNASSKMEFINVMNQNYIEKGEL